MHDLSPLKILHEAHSIIQKLICAVLLAVQVQNMPIPMKFLVFYLSSAGSSTPGKKLIKRANYFCFLYKFPTKHDSLDKKQSQKNDSILTREWMHQYLNQPWPPTSLPNIDQLNRAAQSGRK